MGDYKVGGKLFEGQWSMIQSLTSICLLDISQGSVLQLIFNIFYIDLDYRIIGWFERDL